MAKILVADDETTLAKLVQLSLSRKGHQVTVAANGTLALAQLQTGQFDVLVTDWMMPELDGIGLIRKTRALIRPCPGIVMMTAITLDDAKQTAIEAGADEYIEKPFLPDVLVEAVERCLARMRPPVRPVVVAPRPTTPVPPAKSTPSAVRPARTTGRAPFPAVVIAASTGGPESLVTMLRDLGPISEAAFLVVQHGPAWMLQAFSQRLQKETTLKVHLATDDEQITKGHLYLAPGDRHLCVRSSYRTQISNDPPENFVKPAADPLFRTAAAAFGARCLAVVMTGMGHDGAAGAVQVSEHGGEVIVQDPKTAVVSSMPQGVINTGISHFMAPLSELGAMIARHVKKMV